MGKRTIPAGAKCLTPQKVCEKFSRNKSWLWDRIKADPKFPRPIYLSKRAPVFLEHECDAYIEAQANVVSSPTEEAA